MSQGTFADFDLVCVLILSLVNSTEWSKNVRLSFELRKKERKKEEKEKEIKFNLKKTISKRKFDLILQRYQYRKTNNNQQQQQQHTFTLSTLF